MASKAVILHGTDGSPESNWFPWLREQLELMDLNVWVPHLPENHAPNRFTYDRFLRESNWDFSENILIGHSSGATTALNLLQSDWFPRVDTVILVGTFLNEKLTKYADWHDPGQFDNLFPNKFEVESIKSKANNFYFIHGSDDPYCDIKDAKELCEQLSGTFIEVENGLHLSSNRKEMPEIVAVLSKTNLKK